jgi:hypothetical protein
MREEHMTSRFGKPQLSGEVKGKRLMEAKCPVCDKTPKGRKPPKNRSEAMWREV